MSSLYIVIPAYNESANIERTIDQWYPVVERHNDEVSETSETFIMCLLRSIGAGRNQRTNQ